MSEVVQQIIASCSGALVTSLFMTPLDVVKIRLQAQTKGFAKGECFIYCNGLMDHVCTCLNGDPATAGSQAKLWKRVPHQQFTGMMDAFIKIPKVEGVRTLWSGLNPTLVMAVPNTVVYFTSYDQVKRRLGFVNGEQNSKLIPFVSGATARAVAITVISPLELIRTKIQSEQMTYQQTKEAIKFSLRTSGVASLWRGWGPLMWRDVPFSAVYFTLYESMKGYSMSYHNTDHIPTWESFLINTNSYYSITTNSYYSITTNSYYSITTNSYYSITTNSYYSVTKLHSSLFSICAALTLPFDVVKTHRQIELGTHAAASSSRNQTTFTRISKLYRTQGLASLFTGLGPRLLKVAPACAIMISSYEYCKRLFSEYNLEKSLDEKT
ncbi:SLC25A40 [Bugula neritina]|uniref:SLC25A40 n=1 Tax=Bugula neritina TaxID=10212 RepID=A0A7J7JV07_BUGNE|nr:SLC25A40 [Bugula neritina]